MVVDIHVPILGADFLLTHAFMVDMASHALVHQYTEVVIPGESRPHHTAAVTIDLNLGLTAILSDFPQVTTECFSWDLKHGLQLFIETSGHLVFTQPCCLPPDKLAAVKAEFQKIESMGVVQHCKNPWSSPLHVMHKPDGTW